MAVIGEPRTVGLRPHYLSQKQGKKLMGHYLYAGHLWPGHVVQLFKNQFIGCHRCLCITLTRPKELEDLVSIGADLMETSTGDPITWLGTVKCESRATGFNIYIPKQVWTPSDIIRMQAPYHTPGYIEEVRGKVSRQRYYIFNVPALTRELLVQSKLANCMKGKSDG
ncbi:hypothetical protein LCGC14_0475970 [marine sediment metagenome]|uniref:Uncharacterized protein n=1 Tax=marine sediment metagenome TaxID=412755 RepID=A0A0F9SAT2_9ZZZZ